MSWWWIPAAGWDARERRWKSEKTAPHRRGTQRRTARNAKLTVAQLAEIRALPVRRHGDTRGPGFSHVELAKRYGVSKSLIRRVRNAPL